MPIEFDPPALQVVIEGPYAAKRLKNRGLRLEYQDKDGIPFREEGDLQHVLFQAQALEERGVHVVVSEARCTNGFLTQ